MCKWASKAAGNETGCDDCSRCWMLGADVRRMRVEKIDLMVDEILEKVVVPKLDNVAACGFG